MDIVKNEKVNVCNSVLVTGLTRTEIDGELEEHLKRYGSINRVLVIDDPKSNFHLSSIVEFAHSSAMYTLGPTLPIELQSTADASVIFTVCSLDSVYSSAASSSATKGYLKELTSIANKSGRSFLELLQGELIKIEGKGGVTTLVRDVKPKLSSHDLDELVVDAEVESVEASFPPRPQSSQQSLLLDSISPENFKTLPAVFPPSPSLQCDKFGLKGDTQAEMALTSLKKQASIRSPQVMSSPTRANEKSSGASGYCNQSLPLNRISDDGVAAVRPLSLTVDDVNPSAVQRMVVEHVVRANESLSTMHSSFRLRPFSGKIPRPNSELDYETWRTNVDLILTDPSMSNVHKTRKILDSLLPPATDVIKHVSPQALPSVYLQLLDSVYGSVEDGDELLAKFMATLQNQDEKPSTYLNRLLVALSAVVRRGGVAETERDRYLLKQFCRGCWNDGLISDLQLERKTKAPPSFTELVLLVRTEEDKQASKQSRMKQYLGLNKQSPAALKLKVATQQQTACSCTTLEKKETETESLKKQLNEIQAQIAVMRTTIPCKTKGKHPDTIHTLKQQMAGVQAQIADMRTANLEADRDPLDSVEVRALRQQLAILQAQVHSQQMPSSACQRDFSRTMQYQLNKKASKQTNAGQAAKARPRPWYCFNCGEDAHLAVTCVNEPNSSLVEKKRRLLKEKQEKWDQQFGTMEFQHLNC